MYICKDCGNYYEFNGNSVAAVINKVNKLSGGYEEETDHKYEGIDFISCSKCDSDNVDDIDFNTLPEDLQKGVYNILNIGAVVDIDIMKKLKEFVNK